MSSLRAALVSIFLLSAWTGAVYPLAVTLSASALFPDSARGSLVVQDGRAVGSRLLGQAFAAPRYFHGRPSAAGGAGYDAMASGGSNLGPTSRALRDRIAAAIASGEGVRDAQGRVIADSVTASASGLDPHVSPENALAQAPRVAASRGRTVEEVRQLVHQHTEARILGVLGEPRVNVLALNLALDGAPPPQGKP